MAFVRKTRDEYDVEGNYGYGHGWEAVTCEETLREARARLREYRENEPGVPFRLRKRRVPIFRDEGWDEPTGYCTDHGSYDPADNCPGCVKEAVSC